MKRTTRDQRGIISIMVTMIMMVVITLIVLGFAEVARNEQRNSLDDTLSVQAYYAAESGINDVRSIITNDVKTGNQVQSKQACAPNSDYPADNVVDAAHNVSYSCVLVNAAPDQLFYDISSKSKVVPIISKGSSVGALNLKWTVQSPNNATGCYTNAANLNNNPPASGTGAWGCPYPMVRVDLVDASSAFSRAAWDGVTSTIFLVPFNSTTINNSISMSNQNGTAQAADCDNTSCIAKISGMGNTRYFMRVTALYGSARLTISSQPLGSLLGAQATIDATGKAQDVLRRVLVAVDLTDANSTNVPAAAIISRDSICKRFETANANTFIVPSGDANLSNPTGADGNPFCSAFNNSGTYPPSP